MSAISLQSRHIAFSAEAEPYSILDVKQKLHRVDAGLFERSLLSLLFGDRARQLGHLPTSKIVFNPPRHEGLVNRALAKLVSERAARVKHIPW
jgi:hypothetical protein